MKKLLIVIIVCITSLVKAQVDLGEFTMSNQTSPAFLLVEESPTSIYTPENIKALSVHVLDNLGESLSIELTPYFYINTKSKDRTYEKYIGVEKNPSTNEIKQYPFRGLNTTSISFAYVDKEFASFIESKKTYSIGARTTILRFYNKNKVYENKVGMANALSNIVIPPSVISEGEEAIKKYYADNQDAINKLIEPFQKTIKPFARLDGAIGYSALFKENTTNSSTVNRLGGWLTAETSFILNEGAETKHNNYFNLLLTARYIEDGFNIDANQEYFDAFYRDFGGKAEFEFGSIAFSYEYISRNGTITSERSVGTLTYTFNENISISGGFGKDFPEEDNLITVFGIHWGINLGNENIPISN